MKKLVAILAMATITISGCSNKPENNSASAQPADDSNASSSQREHKGPQSGREGRGRGPELNKSADKQLAEMIKTVPQRFQSFSFTDPDNGNVMQYNLFIPDNYDGSQSYPLVLFMPDASTVGRGTEFALTQGWGGMIWATEASQKEHPAFVLVPAFNGPEWAVSGKNHTTSEVDTAFRLLTKVVDEYQVDKHRIYTTGQSMGGMISFYFNSIHPDLFAASLFVGSQWDIDVLKPLEQMNFFYIVSGGDESASGGMKEVGTMLDKDQVDYGKVQFSAKLPDAEQEAKVQSLIDQGHKINFVMFDSGSVLPEGVSGGRAGDHMYSFDYAYKLDNVRDWLFAQSKEDAVKKPRNGTPGRRHSQRPVAELLPLANAGDSRAASQLGDAYAHGEGGVEQDDSRAFRWYRQAAKAGEPRALLNLALAYYQGQVVEQDYARAFTLFQQAAEAGDFKAPRYLGMLYEQGLGVAQDNSYAMAMYLQAANHGDITAAARVGWMYERGIGIKQSDSTALQWYRKAVPSEAEARQNIHPRVLALLRMGYLYEHGLGTSKDLAQARRYYTLAAQDTKAENGEAEQARQALERLASEQDDQER